MGYEIRFEDRSGYLFAKVTGDNSVDAVEHYMTDVLARCRETGCFRVLIHECLEGPRLSPVDIYKLISEGSKKGLGQFKAIALVDEQMGEQAKFAEDVGVNRGLPLAVFDDLAAAARWISRTGAAQTTRPGVRQRSLSR